MADATKLLNAAINTYELIRLKQKAVELATEMRDALILHYELAKRGVDVPAATAIKPQYRVPLHEQYVRWSRYARCRLSLQQAQRSWGYPQGLPTRVVTHISLGDQTVDLVEPVFREGSPLGTAQSQWLDSKLSDDEIPPYTLMEWIAKLGGAEAVAEVKQRRLQERGA